jgi:SAM-dependent methyltransferase
VVGGRFEDEEDGARVEYEEEASAHAVSHYWAPIFRRLLRVADRPPRLLAVGCGIGAEVDCLTDAGFDCMGVDCGERARAWSRRKRPEALVLANGMHLPFADATFDGAFCGCVFPHVGVEGDSAAVTGRHREDRRALAREMTRVVRSGGAIVLTSPNRLFPCDIFHGRESGSYRVRPYWPGDPFLLSVGDYRALFVEAGCRSVEALPVEGYWGFTRSRRSLPGYLLGLPVRLAFWLASRDALGFLRPSPLLPWISVLARR